MKWFWNCDDDVIMSLSISCRQNHVFIDRIELEHDSRKVSFYTGEHSTVITQVLISFFDWMFARDISSLNGLVFDGGDAVIYLLPRIRHVQISILSGGSSPSEIYCSIHFDDLREFMVSLKSAIDDAAKRPL